MLLRHTRATLRRSFTMQGCFSQDTDMNFAEILEAFAVSADNSVTIPTDWGQGRAGYGGLVAALVVAGTFVSNHLCGPGKTGRKYVSRG